MYQKIIYLIILLAIMNLCAYSLGESHGYRNGINSCKFKEKGEK